MDRIRFAIQPINAHNNQLVSFFGQKVNLALQLVGLYCQPV